MTAPAVPTGLTATTISQTQIDLDWNNNTEVDFAFYRVRRNGTIVASPTASNHSDTGLTEATTYSYTVSAVDLSGNESAQSAAVVANTKYSFGRALRFTPDGVNNALLSFGDHNDFSPTSDKISWAFWAKTATTSGSGCILLKRTNSAFEWSFLRSGTGLEVALEPAGAPTVVSANYGVGFAVDTWKNIVIVYDGTQGTESNRIKVYNNGTVMSHPTWTGTVPTSIENTTLSCNIGALQGLVTVAPYSGVVDEVMIWNRALTAQEAADVNNQFTITDGLRAWWRFNADSFVDSSGQAHTGSISGTAYSFEDH